MGEYYGPQDAMQKMAGVRWQAITASDTELTRWVRGIYVGGTGNLVITDWWGTDMTFTNLAAGVIHMIPARTVKAATTCTGILGCE